MIFQLGT